MLTWDPKWRPISEVDFPQEFVDNDRSIFYKIATADQIEEFRRVQPQALEGINLANPRSLLIALQAEISQATPKSVDVRDTLRTPGDNRTSPILPEGYLLAERGSTLDYLYATQRGALVFFDERSIPKRRKAQNAKARLLRDDSRPHLGSHPTSPLPLVTLNYLYYNCSAYGVLWPTQVAGLVEAGVSSAVNKSFDSDLMLRKWMTSLMVSTNAVVIRIPAANFTKMLDPANTDPWIWNIQMGKVSTVNKHLRVRAFEILAQRFGTRLRNSGLHERQSYDRLLAYYLYEYARGTELETIFGTTHKVAFYLNIKDSEVAGEVRKLSQFRFKKQAPIHKVKKAKSHPEYSLNREACLAYYAESFK